MRQFIRNFDDGAIAVRYLAPNGHYPMFNLNTTQYVLKYIPEHNLLYSAVKLKKEDSHYYRSETSWAFISEIRLWSALALSVHPEDGKYTIAPLDHPLVFYEKEFRESYFVEILEATRIINRSTIIPPWKTDEKYEFHHLAPDLSLVDKLYNVIDPTNKVLLRGLSCLLKSSLLSQSRLAMEEAALLCYISLEGISNLLREKLQLKKQFDLYSFMEANVPNGKFLADYLKECRLNRNILAHPDSDLCTDLLPNLSSDDYFETYECLVELYRYVLLSIPIRNDH